MLIAPRRAGTGMAIGIIAMPKPFAPTGDNQKNHTALTRAKIALPDGAGDTSVATCCGASPRAETVCNSVPNSAPASASTACASASPPRRIVPVRSTAGIASHATTRAMPAAPRRLSDEARCACCWIALVSRARTLPGGSSGYSSGSTNWRRR
ncbi:MAG: hypothetical protein A3G38_03200 [Omnitrophica WOR_2 bacterium RIFCSPLOWO2_12_FULL_51_8]|nr:MAG: hypothetical protein A3G38_03200 [Omnitrophica WOR_2 bacterium RIFCSPLOWO2_12_FULL_51_8]